MDKYDVIIIGGGPGGYVCAIKCAQLGKNVACIDNSEYLGGTCLNVGCVPSKALLNITHDYNQANKHFEDIGLEFKELKFSLQKIMKKKYDVLSGLGKGIEILFKKNKISYYKGFASFESENKVNIISSDKKQTVIEGAKIVIATGSESVSFPGIDVDEKSIITSRGALSLASVPKKMLVIGGGVIGVELGSVWSRLGSDVTIVEYGDDILYGFDKDIRVEAKKTLEKQGLKFKTSSSVEKIDKHNKSISVTIKNRLDNSIVVEDTDVVLVSIGRKANTSGLGVEKIGLKLDDTGRVMVDHQYRTNVGGVYAIGDVISGPMLAHKASDEGIALAEILDGQLGHVNYNLIPNVVYTTPEIASVGQSEHELKGIEYKVGKFPFLANSRARAVNKTQGFVKILSCKSTDRILGVHIIGENAGELISEAVIAMEYKASAEDIARICMPHPTFSEAIKESALSAWDKAIHI